MSVTSVDKDFDRLTLTVVADFGAPIERVWQLWADPRQLERWWGPPSWRVTVREHDLTLGGSVTYTMTGPAGEQSHGWWRIAAVDPRVSLEFVDGSADPEGRPVGDAPTTLVQVEFAARGGGTRMVVRSIFDSREQMEQLVSIGAVEIFVQSIGQMDALLPIRSDPSS